ncbi:peptide chain release factor-like protein [Candidatus Peregrinibacteria bacterium]|nr:peptide chain release factor-like protein [Candidatus Peregrinibacteria bacterium]
MVNNAGFPVILPDEFLDKASRLCIQAEDIDEQFVRGGGKGGQKINKTSSCVLLKHIPTGVEVRCQKHREQSKNRISAYKLLIRKLDSLKMGEESDEAKRIFKIRKQKKRRSRKAKEKMLAEKHRHSEIKENRRKVDF